MTRRRKTLLVVLVAILLFAGSFAWYWQATAVDRQVNALLDEVRKGQPGGIRGWLIGLGLMEDRRTNRGYRRVVDDLAKLGPSAVPPLIRALRGEDLEVRFAAVWALGRLKDPGVVDPLIAALRDESPDVRLYVAMELGELGDLRAVRPLPVGSIPSSRR